MGGRKSPKKRYQLGESFPDSKCTSRHLAIWTVLRKRSFGCPVKQAGAIRPRRRTKSHQQIGECGRAEMGPLIPLNKEGRRPPLTERFGNSVRTSWCIPVGAKEALCGLVGGGPPRPLALQKLPPPECAGVLNSRKILRPAAPPPPLGGSGGGSGWSSPFESRLSG